MISGLALVTTCRYSGENIDERTINKTLSKRLVLFSEVMRDRGMTCCYELSPVFQAPQFGPVRAGLRDRAAAAASYQTECDRKLVSSVRQ